MTAVAIKQTDGATEKWPFRFEVIPIDVTYTDRFQRPLNDRWLVEREGDAFDPALLGAVVVSERRRRAKQFSAVDGQHRIELCRRAGLTEVPAIVFYDLTLQQEAILFSRLQRERRGITPFQRFQADLVAEDPQARAVLRIVKDEGLELSDSSDAPGHVKCVVALERIYEDDPATLRMVLSLSQRAWRDLPLGRAERLIKGLWMFVRDTEDLDVERFVERLGRTTPSRLQMSAMQLRAGHEDGGSLPGFLAEAIQNAYRAKKRR